MEKVKLITLLATHGCNLRCKYCYVRDFSGGDMTAETAKATVRHVFETLESEYTAVEFTFLGGEPFRNFPLVKEISEWMWQQEWPVPFILSAVTNGTLITGEVREWLAANKDRFFPSLSYDGEHAQGANRTHRGIDPDFFLAHWPKSPVKMTVTAENAATFASDAIALRKRGILVNDTFAGGGSPWPGEALAALSRQLQLLCDAQLAGGLPGESDLLAIDLRPALDGRSPLPFACGGGKSRLTYDIDGKCYPCHLLSPLVMTGEQLAVLSGEVPRIPKAECATCPLDPVCPTCEGNSFRLYGCFGRREDSLCEPFKRQAFYACRYQAKRILRKAEPAVEDRKTLAAIRALLKDPSWVPGDCLPAPK